jgi:hypothetical protein
MKFIMRKLSRDIVFIYVILNKIRKTDKDKILFLLILFFILTWLRYNYKLVMLMLLFIQKSQNSGNNTLNKDKRALGKCKNSILFNEWVMMAITHESDFSSRAEGM